MIQPEKENSSVIATCPKGELHITNPGEALGGRLRRLVEQQLTGAALPQEITIIGNGGKTAILLPVSTFREARKLPKEDREQFIKTVTSAPCRAEKTALKIESSSPTSPKIGINPN